MSQHPLYSSLGAYTVVSSFSAPPSSFSVGHDLPYYFTSSALREHYPTAVPSSEEPLVSASTAMRAAEIFAVAILGLIALWALSSLVYFFVELARVRKARREQFQRLLDGDDDSALFEIGDDVDVDVESDEGRAVIADA